MGGLPRLFAPLAVVYSLLLPAPQGLASETTAPGLWRGWAELGGSAGTQRSLGESEIFLPFLQGPRDLTFVNLRGVLDDADGHEGSLGIGYRRMLLGGWNLGGYAFLDQRRTSLGNRFRQTTLGVEALSRGFDLRANAYFPFGERSRPAPQFLRVETSGAGLQMRAGQERALSGFDAEIGLGLPLADLLASDPDGLDLRVYIGGYHFDADGVEPVTGPRLRSELRLLGLPGFGPEARLTLKGEIQNDEMRGRQAFAGLRLRLPFPEAGSRWRPSRRTLTYQELRMLDRVRRDVDVMTASGALGAPEGLLDAETGESLSNIPQATAGDDLQAAVDALAPNETLLIDGSRGEIVIEETLELSGGRSLGAAGGVRAVIGERSGQRAWAQLPGSPGAIRGQYGADGPNPVVAVRQGHSRIENVELRGGRIGVLVTGPEASLELVETRIFGGHENGIVVLNGARAWLSDVRIEDVGLTALALRGGARVEAQRLTVAANYYRTDIAIASTDGARLTLIDSRLETGNIGIDTGGSFFLPGGSVEGRGNHMGPAVGTPCIGNNSGSVTFRSGILHAASGCRPE